MSDTILRLIPVDPNYVPSEEARQGAQELLSSYCPNAKQMRCKVSEEIEFIDQGSNFERVSCPSCKVELDLTWWKDAMDVAFSATHFRELMATTPCCGKRVSINDLEYEWPAGFARFVLEVENPGIQDLTNRQMGFLERRLGCKLREIWAHY